jgi:hypothetical protein
VRVLLDECLPGRKLKPAFSAHEVRTVADMGWRGIKNGALLALAEPEFDAFVTVDGSLQYQQDTPEVDLLILVLRAPTNRLEHLLPLVADADTALERGGSRKVVIVGA